jgi:GntR family transcriptional repressor for pyruvate dehydrogenase complex
VNTLENTDYQFKKISKKTLPMSVVEQIQILVKDGQLKVDERLPSERELAERLGVSRPSIREAMRILESLGMVTVKSGSGAYLNSEYISKNDIGKLQEMIDKYTKLELVEARIVLEGEIAYIAANKATELDKKAIEEAYIKMELLKDDDNAFLLADYAFHMAIADACKNRVLKAMLKTLRKSLMGLNVEIVKVPRQIENVMALHGKILDYLFTGDGENAKAYMVAHLENVEQAIEKMYQEK